MLDLADFIVLNKFDKRGAEDALRDVRKQWRRNRSASRRRRGRVPVYPTIASQFDDAGIKRLFGALCAKLDEQWAATPRVAAASGLDANRHAEARRPSSRSAASATWRRSPAGGRGDGDAATQLRGRGPTLPALYARSRALGDPPLPAPLEPVRRADARRAG